MIPYGRQEITEEDIAAVTEALRAELITQGPRVPAFEADLADRVGAAHAVAMNSASSALHAACRALGLGPGGLMWTSPVTYVASPNAARLCGADVDFVDVDPETLNMDPAALAARLAEARERGRLPDVVMPVHFAGRSCDMRAIGALAEEYGFRVIEDAAHAVGARHADAPVGACVFSDITVFSFHPVKIVTTGEGGAATTGDPELAARLRRVRSHGVTRDTDGIADAPDGPWAYAQIELGGNYRMTEMQAALGRSQLRRLTAYVERRNALAERYDRALAHLPVTPTPRPAPPDLSACHLYAVRLDAELVPRRRRIFEAMRAAGVGVNVHYIPVHTQPYYRARGFAPGDFPEAERYYAGALTLPLFPTMAEADQNRVVAALERALDTA